MQHQAQHFVEEELRFDIKYEPSEAFTEFLLYVREHSTEFTCHHKKFYWRVCASCHRDATQANALKNYHRDRVLRVLSEARAV